MQRTECCWSAGRVQCADEELAADDGERIDMTCSLRYSGSADAGWRVDWQRDDSEQVLASFVEDSKNSVKRSYRFVANYGHSDSNYSCSVTSRRPPYNDNCTTQLRVSCKSILVTEDLILFQLCTLFCCLWCLKIIELTAVLLRVCSGINYNILTTFTTVVTSFSRY